MINLTGMTKPGCTVYHDFARNNIFSDSKTGIKQDPDLNLKISTFQKKKKKDSQYHFAHISKGQPHSLNVNYCPLQQFRPTSHQEPR